ncbi:MAG TPA: ABC transporter substrate-binding protein, partial [Candidatus Obscuribacterales bacterium]
MTKKGDAPSFRENPEAENVSLLVFGRGKEGAGKWTVFTRLPEGLLAVSLLMAAAFAFWEAHALSQNGSSKRSQVVFGMCWEPVGFFPLRALDSASYYAQTLVYQGLVMYNPALEVVPALAESFSVSKDGLTYRFKLRSKARFSDGQPITADDVMESLRLASSKYSPYREDYRDLKRILLTKPDEVTLELSRPCAPLLARLVELRILPSRLLKSADRGKAVLSRKPVSSGPFILRRWESGLELVFEANPHYWGEKPKVKRLIWRLVPEMSLLSLAVNRGDIDVAQVDAPSYDAFLRRNKSLKIESFSGSRTIYLGFNLEREPWDERDVRRAIAMSIDRAALVEKVLRGWAMLPNTDFPPGRWAYDKEIPALRFDPKGASALLFRCGFKVKNACWERTVKGKRQLLAFKLKTAKDFTEVAQCVASQLRKNHILAEVEVVEFSALRNRYLVKGDYDVVLWSRSSGTDPDCVLVWGSGG